MTDVRYIAAKQDLLAGTRAAAEASVAVREAGASPAAMLITAACLIGSYARGLSRPVPEVLAMVAPVAMDVAAIDPDSYPDTTHPESENTWQR